MEELQHETASGAAVRCVAKISPWAKQAELHRQFGAVASNDFLSTQANGDTVARRGASGDHGREYRRQFDSNVLATLLTVKTALPLFRYLAAV